jgi:predicted metalloprotease with PDZ domain
MRFTAPLLAALALLAAACATREPAPPPPPRPELRYYVKSAEDRSLLQVTLVAENLRSDSIDFTFPVWLPGDFRPIEPGRWVEDVRAYDRSTVELPVRRLGSNLWRIYPRGAQYFLISYTLHPVRPDGFKRSLISELTRSGGYFTGAVAFGYLKGLENYPLSLTFEFGSGWPAVCSLEGAGPGRYSAANAYELSQAGCAYGSRLRELKTVVDGVPYRVVLVAPPGFAADSLLGIVHEVAESQSSLFRATPFPEYTFFLHFVEPTGAGLGASPLFHGSAYYLPEIQHERIRFSGIPYLLAHQLFHAWNLWAFPPSDLQRPSLDREVATRALWLIEGMAEHYARVGLARSRVLPRAEIYSEISRDLRTLDERRGAARANLESVSAAAGQPVEREVLEPLALKSPLAALAVDVELRRASANAFGADSLLRYLEGGESGPRVLPYDSIVGWALELGGPPLRALYAGAIAGPGALPYAEILSGAGLELVTREVEELNLGASLVPDGQGSFTFQNIQPQGIGGRMGLRPGDRLLAVNQQPVTPDNLLPLLAVLADLRSGLREGKPVTVQVRRGGVDLELEGQLLPWTREVMVVVESEWASAAAAALREAIFSGERRQALGS